MSLFEHYIEREKPMGVNSTLPNHVVPSGLPPMLGGINQTQEMEGNTKGYKLLT